MCGGGGLVISIPVLGSVQAQDADVGVPALKFLAIAILKVHLLVHPFIDTSLPPINAGAPVELDSTPVSPVVRKQSWKVPQGGTITEPGTEQETYEELTGATGTNETLRQVSYSPSLAEE